MKRITAMILISRRFLLVLKIQILYRTQARIRIRQQTRLLY